jgi:tetratricopeptide (TPR) repeat protein
MVHVTFALNYRQQLRNTQTRLLTSLEKSIIELIQSCGGSAEQEHNCLYASFNEQNLAFWLDIVVLIEQIDHLLKDSADELYGHVCLIASQKIDFSLYSGMLKELSFHGTYSGIWIAKDISVYLQPYVVFDDEPPFSFITKKHFEVIQVKTIETWKKSADNNLFNDMKDLWEIAYMCHHLNCYFPKDACDTLFCEEGKNPLLISRAFETLTAQGIISSPHDPKPIMADFAENAEKILSQERINLIKSMVRNRLLSWIKDEKLTLCFNLIAALTELGGEVDDDLIIDAVYRDVISGTYKNLQDSIDSGQFYPIAGAHRSRSLVYIFHTLVSLIHGNAETIRNTFLVAPPDENSSPRYTSYIQSNMASYQLSIRNVEEAAKSVKKAMMAAQSVKSSRGEARAFRLYALMNVMQRNMADAIEYLQFAADHAKRNKDWEESVIISYYAAVVQFLYGNISKAEQLAGHAESHAVTYQKSSWAAKSRFLKGRIFFEQGKYAEAYHEFATIIPTEENKDTLNAWKYRAKIYVKGLLPSTIKNEGDGAIFMIEAAYLNQEYEKAVALADHLLLHLEDQNYFFTEQTDWQSGFSQIECLMFPQKDFLHRLVSTYRALALSHQASAAAEAVSIMQHIIRDEQFHGADTNDAFYYFAQYYVLQHTDALEIDLMTAVSMAFKRLQHSASRIDDIEAKRNFLSLNQWNKALCEVAKYHRLI